MRYLKEYLDRANFWRVNIDKKPAITVDNMTLEDANRLAESLVSDMSPENLSCDGELSHAQVNARYRLYKNAAAELLALFPDLTKPQWDDGLFDAPASLKGQFRVGQKVAINHERLGGRAVGTVLKINRVRARVEFPAAGTFNVPFEMMEIV